MDDLHFGVHEAMMYASNTPPVPGAQWTGIVTQIALEMLSSGAVEAVVCVQSDEDDRFTPRPVRGGALQYQPIALHVTASCMHLHLLLRCSSRQCSCRL
jgi:hypothetical protein